jgi:ABC-type transport system involved in cytochrome c biogenesis permease subunit
MEMLQAVLDTNLWLATHVVVVTSGYASMFVAGILAIIYVVRGFFTSTLTPDVAKTLSRMVYGIVCFATLFSFVGTILGGIWADQSWGRFWGWDPKENGALLIVLWNALILHARWGGMIRERGLMAMAVFGNIITSFSWFGVNMLGIGLHSYGFMDKAFPWLVGFDISQVLLVVLALMPLRFWASFKAPASPAPPAGPSLPAPSAIAM